MMASVLLASRLMLALVFVVAGVAKLFDLAGSRRAVADFGVPDRLAGGFGLLVPLCELLIAGMLLGRGSARWAALAAALMLLVFACAIGLSLRRGKAHECHCFGQLSASAIGFATFVRTVLLAVLAAAVTAVGWDGSGPSATGWVGSLDEAVAIALAAGIVVFGIVALQGWLLLVLLRQNGRLLRRLEAVEARLGGSGAPGGVGGGKLAADAPAGLPVGREAPDFALAELGGEWRTRKSLLVAGVPLLLVFSDPACGSCSTLLPDIAGWQRQQANAMTVALLSRGSADRNRAMLEEHGLVYVLLDEDGSTFRAYEASGTPSAVVIDAEGRIVSPLARGTVEVRLLAARIASGRVVAMSGSGSDQPWTLGIGEAVPPLALPDATGRMTDLSRPHRGPRLIVLWDSHCPYCRRMLPQLQALEADRSPRAPDLLLVESGARQDKAGLGLQAPVLFDPARQVMRLLGARGTPSGLLLDAGGAVASPPVIGADAVIALAVGQRPQEQEHGQGQAEVRQAAMAQAIAAGQSGGDRER
ncbi:MAG TPA: MauE/DoxX family redox-associated membrane protein [Solirubrobacteraceae bacterium]|jgi:peroxiredoxin